MTSIDHSENLICLFTIMTYKHPELIQYFEIEMDGLLSTFFENLKNKTIIKI